MSYRANSAIGRMAQFFKDNPGEFLTYADVAAKFGIGIKTVPEYVRRLNGALVVGLVVYANPDPREGPQPRRSRKEQLP